MTRPAADACEACRKSPLECRCSSWCLECGCRTNHTTAQHREAAAELAEP